MTYWFDMDGTIADLYTVENWLAMLIAEDTTPYRIAKPLVNLARLAKYIHKAQASGNKVGIISWTSKGGTDAYNMAVAGAKMEWLAKHLPSVTWDEIKIVPYGTNKKQACGDGILFDDEAGNRNAWGKGAFEPSDIFAVMMQG